MKKPKEIKGTVDTELLKSVSILTDLTSDVATLAGMTSEIFERMHFLSQMQTLIWSQTVLMFMVLALSPSIWAIVPLIGQILVSVKIINDQSKEHKRMKNFIDKNL